MNNIEVIRDTGLCISCGVCAAICPKKCITYNIKECMYLPQIESDCINCGRCLRVCPSENLNISIDPLNISSYILGNYQQILKAKISNKDILLNSTSGGVVTGLISELLKRGEYHTAFAVVGYDYHKKVETVKIESSVALRQSGGSRYLPVSHTDAVRWICENRDKKAIIVATSCAVDAIVKSIRMNQLKRDNYLIIGLFCDKTMHYGVVDYFDNVPETCGHNIKEFYFRSKVGSKWPGGVRIVLDNNETILLPSSARKKLKDYFVPERCLYCLNKLNVNADISVGDNYIKENADEEGISSVIIRTAAGQFAWDTCSSLFEWAKDDEQDLLASQLVENKQKNYAFGCLKGIYYGRVPFRIRREYFDIMRKRKLGYSNNTYINVTKDIKKCQLILRVKRRVKSIFRFHGQ